MANYLKHLCDYLKRLENGEEVNEEEIRVAD
jgi:hypothetical protein